jgi:hypothetical protein
MAILTRRSLLGGLFAAPAVVKAASLMPVKLWVPEPEPFVQLINQNGLFLLSDLDFGGFFARPTAFWGDAVASYLRDCALGFDDGV